MMASSQRQRNLFRVPDVWFTGILICESIKFSDFSRKMTGLHLSRCSKGECGPDS